jgi:hypothetical protein
MVSKFKKSVFLKVTTIKEMSKSGDVELFLVQHPLSLISMEDGSYFITV